RPSKRMRVALASKPRRAIVAAPTAVLEPFSLFETGIMFALAMGRLWRNRSVVNSPDLVMFSRLYVSTGFGPTSSAVGIFEPVTMTRWASAAGGVGAAPMSVDSGATFWANAFDAIVRGIPTQATRVMRRNTYLGCPILIMGFSFGLGWILRKVQAAPHVRFGFIPRKPEGNSKCQAEKLCALTFQQSPSRLQPKNLCAKPRSHGRLWLGLTRSAIALLGEPKESFALP